ncbi:SRPBCC family protein [Nocardia sp. NPDC059177]|uniref:type II toxin-antitoxin system Rv0910 family toxin n=1 Tax=Nocardia sp. NPDC059177 TaxID=3346759 RepID=UPI0036AB1D59
MGTISITKTLPGDPAALFGTITRPQTWKHWFTIHREFVGEAPEQLGPGAQVCAKVTMLGMNGDIEWTVLDVEPARLVRLSGRAMAGLTCAFTYDIRPSGSGADITVEGEFTGPLITGVLARTLEKHGRQQLDQSLDQLAAFTASN